MQIIPPFKLKGFPEIVSFSVWDWVFLVCLFEEGFAFFLVSFLFVILLSFSFFSFWLFFSPPLSGREELILLGFFFFSILKQLRALLSFERAIKLRSLILDLSQAACRYQKCDIVRGYQPEQPCLGSQYRACTESMESSPYLIVTYLSNSFWLLA